MLGLIQFIYVCGKGEHYWPDFVMWRLGYPTMHYQNEVFGWTGASGQDEKESDCISQPTDSRAWGLSNPSSIGCRVG